MISELAVVDDVVEAVTERDASDAGTSDAVAGFAVDTFVEPVASEATAWLVDVATEFAGAELVGSTDVAATVSVTAGVTVVVETLSDAVLGEVAAGTPSPWLALTAVAATVAPSDVVSSAWAVWPIMIKVPSKTEQTPIFNLRIEKRLFLLKISLPIFPPRQVIIRFWLLLSLLKII